MIVVKCDTGYDVGGYSNSLSIPAWQRDFGLSTYGATQAEAVSIYNHWAYVTVFASLGGGFGALASIFINDRWERLRVWQIGILVYIVGNLMAVFAKPHYNFLIFARVFTGIGIGVLSVQIPIYLAEIAPARSRGQIMSWYMICRLIFVMIGKSENCLQRYVTYENKASESHGELQLAQSRIRKCSSSSSRQRDIESSRQCP